MVVVPLVTVCVALVLGTNLVPVPSRASDPEIAEAEPKLDPVPIRTIGSSGHAGLYAWGAATTIDGTVLVGDYWNYRVLEYGADGGLLRTIVPTSSRGYQPWQHQSPYGMGVDPRNGDIYVADTDRKNVDKYDRAGNHLLTFGSPGTGTGKFLYPSRVAVLSDGTVFVVDTWDNNIVVHDPAGRELSQFGSFGTGPGRFRQPHGISVDAGDNLYVADTNNHRVQVFDRTGRYLRSWGSQGTGPGQFEGDMRGVAVDRANGWVYVVDGEADRVAKFDLQGNLLLGWGGSGEGDGEFWDGGREITVDGDGNVWVMDFGNHRAQKFTSEGLFLLEVPSLPEPPPEGGFNGPRGVAVDGTGNVFVTDTYNQRIQKFGSDGSFATAWGRRGRGEYRFNYPRLLAVDPLDQSVVVADTDDHRIKRYDNDGNFQWLVGGRGGAPGQFRHPMGVDVAPDGRIWVADSNNDRVQVLDREGTPLLVVGSSGDGDGQFRYPRGIGVDTDGTVWVTDSIRDDVQQFSADGTFIGSFGVSGKADDELDRPFGVEGDGTYVYVADPPRDKVKVFRRDGTFVLAFGRAGTALGEMDRPQGLDLGPDGTLYVAEHNNERIHQWSLGGPAGEPDLTPPDAVVTSPAFGEVLVGAPFVFGGTAVDDRGVAGVDVAIRNRDTGQWLRLDGTWGGWQRLPTVVSDPGAPETVWSITVDLADGRYGFATIAVDTSGNRDPTRPWTNFSVAS